MSMHTCTGGTLMCTMGLAPATFSATPKTVMTSSMPGGNILDFVPMTNIAPFGMCMSPANPMVIAATSAALGVPTPAPCIPATVSPWTPGAPTVLVGGAPALDSTSLLTCMWAGVITFQAPGQVSELIP